jgi:thymidylate synthase ThyX
MKKIIVIDDLSPEVTAMLQALYSRSPRSVVEHLSVVKEKGPDKFMSTYYVEYGHKSIGDCGSTTVFIENVSMLAAKAIQDYSLYNGQEASTRYLDMAGQAVLNPLENPEGKLIQDEWMRFYSYAQGKVIPFLKKNFPIKEGEKETVYEKAIKARAFDITRGFLPAGVTTFESWHTTLRQASDHLKELRHHPLEEIRDIGEKVTQSLKEKYPASFTHKQYPEEEAFVEKSMRTLTYFDDPRIRGFAYSPRIQTEELRQFQDILSSRPAKAELPSRLKQYGNITFEFPLDFGSYRDLQRHRSLFQEMPLLSTRLGFHSWYLEQLPKDLRSEAEAFLAEQEKRIEALKTSDVIRQYYIAMGYMVPVKITGPLPSLVYVAELRSGSTVHQTLRVPAQTMGETIKMLLPGIAMYHDMSPDTWNIKRGSQDIIKKE